MAFHFSSSSPSSLQSHNFLFLLYPSIASPLSLLNGSLKSAAWTSPKRKSFGLTCRSSISDDEDYLLDAPVSIGDGFSFSGGKYSDGPNPADEWFSRGKIIYVPTTPRGAESLPPAIVVSQSTFYLRRLWGEPSEV